MCYAHRLSKIPEMNVTINKIEQILQSTSSQAKTIYLSYNVTVIPRITSCQK